MQKIVFFKGEKSGATVTVSPCDDLQGKLAGMAPTKGLSCLWYVQI